MNVVSLKLITMQAEYLVFSTH